MGAYTNEMRMKRLCQNLHVFDEFQPEEHMPITAVNGELSPGTQGPEQGRNNDVRYMGSCCVQPGDWMTGERPPDYSKDWYMLAEVVDSLFFWVVLLAVATV